jgi:hypothetical protein
LLLGFGTGDERRIAAASRPLGEVLEALLIKGAALPVMSTR